MLECTSLDVEREPKIGLIREQTRAEEDQRPCLSMRSTQGSW
jgi:hypothetical protein